MNDAQAPPNRKQQTHDRIVDTAAGVLRESGFSGVGVADIMRRAGLTHGGFYAHFASREALLAEALERAGEDSRLRLSRSAEAAAAQGTSAFRALVETYLSERHLRAPESGCPVAALASEMPRQSAQVLHQAQMRLRSLVETVQAALPAGHDEKAPATITAHLVGALQIARALGDNTAGRAQLAESRRFLLEQFDSPPPRR